MKKPQFYMIVLVIMGTACTAQKKNSSSWKNLLKQESTEGWHTYGKSYATSAWTVSDGVLQLNPNVAKSEKGDLVTDGVYENFHLKLEWKISKNGNSGVMFNVNEDIQKYKKPYFTGPEMQVLDNGGHPDAKINKHRAGDLYDLIAYNGEAVKPVGEWNKAEIILNKGDLQFLLNGKQVVKTTMWDAAWDKMVAESKFKAMPDFAKFRSGKIVLQDHGDPVWFRNIYIKNL